MVCRFLAWFRRGLRSIRIGILGCCLAICICRRIPRMGIRFGSIGGRGVVCGPGRLLGVGRLVVSLWSPLLWSVCVCYVVVGGGPIGRQYNTVRYFGQVPFQSAIV